MKPTRLYIGIDPGASGALAVISETYEPVLCIDYHPERCIKALLTLRKSIISAVYLEHVHAMPGNGVVSMFKFGENFGWWKGVLSALLLDFTLVDPKRWQNHFGFVKRTPSDKPSLKFCRKHFPTVDLHLQKHDGRSDALCIASYALDMTKMED